MKVNKKSVKNALRDHRGKAATMLGLVLGAGAAIFYYERDTLIVITDEDFETIRHGRSGVYDTEHGRLFVRMA